MARRSALGLLCVAAVVIAAMILARKGWPFRGRPEAGGAATPLAQDRSPPRRADGQATVTDRLRECGAAARGRLAPHFARVGVAYPPSRIELVAFKQERTLHVYAADADGSIQYIRAYPILAASGQAGPKLREGDRQVPEGIYAIESLNPNSRFHLSLRLNYPNALDRRIARQEGRANLGRDIMIHGKAVSAGCLAMGNEAAEDLFVLASDVGIGQVRLILSPVDFRLRDAPAAPAQAWVRQLYADIGAELHRLPLPPDR